MQTLCEHCGYTYESPPEMAGKRVRCRNCGQVFVISAAAPSEATAPDVEFPEVPTEEITSPFDRKSDTTHAMPAITTTESNMAGGIGSAKSRMERTGDANAYELTTEAPGTLLRPSTPFSFPFAGELDVWLPRLASLLMLVWPAYLLWHWQPPLEEGQSYPAWAGLMPVIGVLLLFALIWLPFFALAMRKVGAALLFSLPSRRFIRAACLASLPFGMGVAFWIAGEGVTSMAIGVFLGTAVAVPAAWFLYRLNEQDIPYAAVALVVASLFATVISTLLYVGINMGVNHAITAIEKSADFAQSPMGPALSWQLAPKPVTVSRPPVARTKPATTVAKTTGTVEAEPFAATVVPLQGDVNGIVHPLTGGNYIAAIGASTPAADSVTISQYSLDPLKQLNSAIFASSVSQAGYAISPGGDLLARVTTFRGGMIQFWSFSQRRVIGTVELGEEGGVPRLLGFLTDSSLLCEWRDGVYVLKTIDPLTRRQAMWTNNSADKHGAIVAVRPNLNLAVTTAKTPSKGTELRLYGPGGQQPIPLTDADPNGLAISPDGSKVALAYEEKGQLQIVIYQRPDGAVIANHIFPGGLELNTADPKDEQKRENRLLWLPDGKLLVYKHLIIDWEAGRVIDKIDVQNIARLSLVSPDTLHIVRTEAPRLYQVKLPAIATSRPATQPALPTTVPASP